MRINLWNSFFENVMNTAVMEVNMEQQGVKYKFFEDLMFIHQDAVNNGGNMVQSKTYINKGAQSNVISGRMGVKNKRITASLAYTHITGDGRYLMPREWGRDPFYTFLPRERNEGAGNVHAAMAKISMTGKNSRFKNSLAYGYYKMPDVKNYRLNKYGMPSYHQINYEAAYSFNKFLNGLDIKFLGAYKLNSGETYGNLRYIYNKVDMLNMNLVVDFKI